MKKKKKDNLKHCEMRPFCVKCLCLGWLSRTEGAEMPPFSQETSGPHRFIFAECIGKAAGGEKGCQRSGAAPRLSLTCAWAPPAPHFQAVGVLIPDAVRSVCAPWGAPSFAHSPRCKTHPSFAPEGAYVLIMCIGRQICPPSQREILYFSRLFALQTFL